MNGAPGTQWDYSNMAFDVLGDVIAKVSGMSFEEYERKYVLEPAGMTASTYLKSPGIPQGWALPHLQNLTPRVWEGYPYNRIHAPSSTLYSSVVDMSRWAIVNLNQGCCKFGKILNSKAYSSLWGNYAAIQQGRGLFHTGGSQGIGWTIGNYRGEEVIGHAGSDVGFASMLILVPKRATAIVLYINTYNNYAFDITSMILDAVLGIQPQRFLPPAGAAALRTLEKQGVEAARDQWNKLKNDHPDDYDFSASYSLNVGGVIFEHGTEEEAKLIARFYRAVMTEDELKMGKAALNDLRQKYPGNKKVQIMLDILNRE
jgi:CubicO group peptidase (beta-lactamase class C family)